MHSRSTITRMGLAAAIALTGAAGTALALQHESTASSVGTTGKARTATPVVAEALPSKAASQDLRTNVMNSMGLLDARIVTLSLPDSVGTGFTTAIAFDGALEPVSIRPHSMRSENYQLRAQVEDGSIVLMQPGEIRTIRGELPQRPGSRLAGALLEDGLYMTVRIPDGETYWVEPIMNRVAGAAQGEHVVYRASDVISSGGVCGVTDETLARAAAEMEGMDAGGDGGIAGGGPVCAELACDADVEYYQDYGSSIPNVENRINLVMNTVDLQYDAEVGIRHSIVDILVRTAEPDPYTSTDAGTLLSQFRTEWIDNQGAIQRDVAQLFTGKAIAGSTIGIAWTIGGICTTSAYCLVQSDCCGSTACATDLSAHELGHLWGGTHCNCPSFTMNPSITCANQHEAGSISQIIAHRDSRTCLASCEFGTTTIPFSDNFPITTFDAAKWSGIEGATIETGATAEPSTPNSVNLDGSATGGDELRTSVMDSTGLAEFKLEYYFSCRGGGANNSPETGEDLVVSYLNSSDTWTELNRHLGSLADMTTFQFVSLNLPEDAKHDGFRIQFRAISNQSNQDDWWIDNVSITGIIPAAFDTCGTAAIAAVGSTPFTTINATSSGPDEGLCNVNGSSAVGSDIWYRHITTCTGTLTVSICDANFDSRLAVYGATCPTVGGSALACDDDGCGQGSTVSIPVNQSQLIRIRIGGFNDAEGTGTLSITCTPTPPACPSDINGDLVVGIADLLSVIGEWGCAGSCSSDVTGDNTVGIADLLAVIGDWGSC